PETSVPRLLHQAQPAFDAMAAAAGGQADILAGVLRWAEGARGGYFNAVVHLTAQGAPEGVYDKHHLVPFGEYMPGRDLFDRLGIDALAALPGGFRAGPGPRVIQTALGPVLPLICYEAVFARHTRTDTRPALIVHLTNDAWFGTYSGPYQHLMQARMRAIETGLPVVRSANTGVSAVIDPAGRIMAQIPLGQAGFADAVLPKPAPITLYARMGDGPLAVFCVVLAGLLWFRRYWI
ncbi:MAG: apolipoprotein N-acyltransferase, partial [Primorskyibacter sp.]